jgi:hypothetical protein
MRISDLKHNPRNPRIISENKLKALKKSVDKFGDLSGFVFNIKTNRLVSGHQRTKTLPPNSTIKKEIKHEVPTSCGTVAEGYVLVGQERFKYREVEWDEQTEVEALLAANKHGGSWDNELLRLTFADFPNLDIDVAGFSMPELNNLGIEIPSIHVETEPEEEEDEETDEQYVRNNPGPESEEKKQIIGEGLYTKEDSESAFDSVNETTTIKDKRILIIISCPSDEIKQELKEEIREKVESKGGAFF